MGKNPTSRATFEIIIPKPAIRYLDLARTQVRSVLWEARQAAEFAAAARAAAASQRAEDSRGLCDIRRDRKKVVRQCKRDLLLVSWRGGCPKCWLFQWRAVHYALLSTFCFIPPFPVYYVRSKAQLGRGSRYERQTGARNNWGPASDTHDV